MGKERSLMREHWKVTELDVRAMDFIKITTVNHQLIENNYRYFVN
jgi:hypothetical protein